MCIRDRTTVTTLVGGSTSAQVNPTGTIPLSEAQFRANIDRCICVDQDKNVFFLVWSHTVLRTDIHPCVAASPICCLKSWCWGQKVFWPLWYTDCFAFHALAILKHLKSAHFSTKNGYFSVFCGSISHAFSCKQETHDLLTLVSNHLSKKNAGRHSSYVIR